MFFMIIQFRESDKVTLPAASEMTNKRLDELWDLIKKIWALSRIKGNWPSAVIRLSPGEMADLVEKWKMSLLEASTFIRKSYRLETAFNTRLPPPDIINNKEKMKIFYKKEDRRIENLEHIIHIEIGNLLDELRISDRSRILLWIAIWIEEEDLLPMKIVKVGWKKPRLGTYTRIKGIIDHPQGPKPKITRRHILIESEGHVRWGPPVPITKELEEGLEVRNTRTPVRLKETPQYRRCPVCLKVFKMSRPWHKYDKPKCKNAMNQRWMRMRAIKDLALDYSK